MSGQDYVGMRPGDLEGKPYARFWRPEMAPLPVDVVDGLRRSEESPAPGFELSEADQLLRDGYLPLENGFTELSSGQTFIAVRTEMPGSTGAMFEWWMGWHPMEAERYKLWHPGAHVANGTREMRGDDPSLSDREKYRTTHYVTEYVGGRLHKIRISFVDPREIFGKDAELTHDGTTALVCGRVDLQRAPIRLGWLIHQFRERGERAELRSRFWLGKPELLGTDEADFRNKLLGAAWVRRLVIPRHLGREMVLHCAAEMNHLARFLPELYALHHPEH